MSIQQQAVNHSVSRWRCVPSEGPFGHYKIVAGGVVIAEVFGGSHQPQAVRAQALKNACLIATAPELLAQLKLILEECKKANAELRGRPLADGPA